MEKIFKFNCEKTSVLNLNPGDLFVYKNSMWLSINRSERGYLSSRFNIDRTSEIIPFNVEVKRVISSSEV